MARSRNGRFAALLALVMLVAGCGSRQRDATQAAINAAESAIDAAQSEAEKYAPEQLQAARTALQNAKDALSKSDYDGALKAAQDAATKAKNLAIAATSNRDEWTKEWTQVTASMPKSLDQVKARLNAYAHGAHLPEGLDQDALKQAQQDYDQLKKSWDDATAAASQGNLRDAINRVPSIKEMLAKLKEKLGVK
jgi:ATP-dependent Clp protease ATP-binding subunit ClpA